MYSIVYNEENSVKIKQVETPKNIDNVVINFNGISYLSNMSMSDLNIVFQPNKTRKDYKFITPSITLKSGECLQDWNMKFDGKIVFYTLDGDLIFRMICN